jgi:hypothetical protein
MTYIDISRPEYLAAVDFGDNVLVSLCHDGSIVRGAATGGHGEIRQEGERGDEGGYDVEQAFLLYSGSVSYVSFQCQPGWETLTTGTLAASP